MENKTIISHPTPNTSPDLLAYGKDNLAGIVNYDNKNDNCIIIPRSFNDSLNSFPVIKKYHHKKYPKKFLWRQTLREIFQYKYGKGPFSLAQNKEESFFIALSFIGTIFASLSSFFIYLNFLCDDPMSEQSQRNATVIFFLVFLSCVAASVWFIEFSPWGIYYDEESIKNKLRYKIPTKDKERVCESQFIYMKKYPSKYLSSQRNILSRMEKFAYEMFMDTDLDIVNSMHSTHISQLYDDVMDMLIFTLANYDSISSELCEDYTEELYKKVEELEKMTEDIKQEAEDVEEHKKNAYQKSLDDEAMMFMPINRKGK